MIPIFRSWIDRYFHNEEAVLVIVLLGISFFLLSLGILHGQNMAAKSQHSKDGIGMKKGFG